MNFLRFYYILGLDFRYKFWELLFAGLPIFLQKELQETSFYIQLTEENNFGSSESIDANLFFFIQKHINHIDVKHFLRRSDSMGNTILHYASALRYYLLIDYLLEEYEKRGKNPAHLAVINTTSINGRTPLHFAALQGHRSTVVCLLAHHASCAKKDINGKTPLYYSRSVDAVPVSKLLNRWAQVRETQVLISSLSIEKQKLQEQLETLRNSITKDQNQNKLISLRSKKKSPSQKQTKNYSNPLFGKTSPTKSMQHGALKITNGTPVFTSEKKERAKRIKKSSSNNQNSSLKTSARGREHELRSLLEHQRMINEIIDSRLKEIINKIKIHDDHDLKILNDLKEIRNLLDGNEGINKSLSPNVSVSNIFGIPNTTKINRSNTITRRSKRLTSVAPERKPRDIFPFLINNGNNNNNNNSQLMLNNIDQQIVEKNSSNEKLNSPKLEKINTDSPLIINTNNSNSLISNNNKNSPRLNKKLKNSLSNSNSSENKSISNHSSGNIKRKNKKQRNTSKKLPKLILNDDNGSDFIIMEKKEKKTNKIETKNEEEEIIFQPPLLRKTSTRYNKKFPKFKVLSKSKQFSGKSSARGGKYGTIHFNDHIITKKRIDNKPKLIIRKYSEPCFASWEMMEQIQNAEYISRQLKRKRLPKSLFDVNSPLTVEEEFALSFYDDSSSVDCVALSPRGNSKRPPLKRTRTQRFLELEQEYERSSVDQIDVDCIHINQDSSMEESKNCYENNKKQSENNNFKGVFPLSKYFELNSSAHGEILFTIDESSESPKQIVSACSIRLVVDWIVDQNTDTQLLDIFLLIFRNYMTADDFFNKLMEKWNQIPIPNEQSIDTVPEQRRIIYIIRKWLDSYYINDFSKNKNLQKSLSIFVNKSVAEHHLEELQSSLNKIINHVVSIFIFSHLKLFSEYFLLIFIF